MQDLIDRCNRETVPLLVKRWPEKFAFAETRMWLKGADGWLEKPIRPTSLDSLAAIAEACGVVTEAHSLCPGKTWYGLYYWGDGFDNSTRVGGYPTELAARLAATIAAIAAIAGGE